MKIHLYQLRINQSGYDPFGKYFGVCKPGEAVYEYFIDPDDPEYNGRYETIRASSREDAKNKIASVVPDARFYR